MDIAGCPRKRINTAGTWKWKSRVLTQKKLVRRIKGLINSIKDRIRVSLQ